jgi:P27 family predicted phage terminase small subunit
MQRTSARVKALRGTYRLDRAPKKTAAERLARVPPAPAALAAGAVAEWRELAGVLVSLGVLTRADLRLLALLCSVLASEKELRDLLQKEGCLIAGADQNMKAHPALKALETCRAQAHRMLESFGLSPRSRQGVDIAPLAAKGRLASLDDKLASGWKRL